jgi:galactose-1-phosphate uridylyltransferase
VNRYVEFEVNISKMKPNTIKNKNTTCPFCNFELLKKTNKIIDTEGTKVLLENKFSTFKKAYQTVYVENDNCDLDLSNYPKEKLFDILSYGLKKWFEMSNNRKFKSVAFIKNNGPYSGASIHHPHMQLVGLENIDYKVDLKDEYFEGPFIQNKNQTEWNLSNKPRSEFYEFNVIMPKEHFFQYLEKTQKETFEEFATCIQRSVNYILTTLNSENKSYNLIFYEFENKIICKIISRGQGKGGVNSAFLLGYNISQTPTNLTDIISNVQSTIN